MATYLTAGYCAATGIYSRHHPPLATVTVSSFPEYLFPRLLQFPPDRPAFVDASTGATLSFADLRTLSLKTATALSALGLRRGHVALLLAPNSLHFPILSFGVLALGAVLSTTNPLLTANELAGQAQDSEPFLALTTAELAPKLVSLMSTRVVLIDQLLAGIDGHEEWAWDNSPVCRDDPALHFYSSGTTGKSKASGADGGGDVDVYGCVLPMFHLFGFSMFVLGTTAMGTTKVLVPGRAIIDVDETPPMSHGCGVLRGATAARANGALPSLLQQPISSSRPKPASSFSSSLAAQQLGPSPSALSCSHRHVDPACHLLPRVVSKKDSASSPHDARRRVPLAHAKTASPGLYMSCRTSSSLPRPASQNPSNRPPSSRRRRQSPVAAPLRRQELTSDLRGKVRNTPSSFALPLSLYLARASSPLSSSRASPSRATNVAQSSSRLILASELCDSGEPPPCAAAHCLLRPAAPPREILTARSKSDGPDRTRVESTQRAPKSP
ncbi:hypothetical protein HU200_002944 [Digitaria exilis]|uniref:AMP-dependent synthetase/ligase domain-containing protein n=1 Tax=Digitaria exilis TaxID=1010633 RepID=A0A835KUU0_9POAL|nr:hypothetical protein HU200_002944 [Digitaria exilis]